MSAGGIPVRPPTPSVAPFDRGRNLRLTHGILNLSGADCIGGMTSAGIALGARKPEW
jgi:hypothetical protein